MRTRLSVALIATAIFPFIAAAKCWSDADCKTSEFCRCTGNAAVTAGIEHCDQKGGQCFDEDLRIGREHQTVLDLPPGTAERDAAMSTLRSALRRRKGGPAE